MSSNLNTGVDKSEEPNNTQKCTLVGVGSAVMSFIAYGLLSIPTLTEIEAGYKKEIMTLQAENAETSRQLLVINDALITATTKLESRVDTNLHKDSIQMYINKAKGISKATKELIFNNVMANSKKYGISPLIVTSLISVESSFMFWIGHKQCSVTLDNGKKAKIRAVGLGGVVWEFWGSKLIQNGIAKTRSDLYKPEVNIEAICYILTELKKQPLKKGAKTATESALLRYFGGNYQTYITRIAKKMFDIIKYDIAQ